LRKKLHNRIGILGGSFDPAHLGHIKISKEAKKKFKLNKVFWVITKRNPFKKKCFFSLHKRIALSKKLVLRHKFIEVVYIEINANLTERISTLNTFVKKIKTQIFILSWELIT
tara:strand:- start:191 stop:529 length:339 start_codon:yes stop_codon:yes gene_type:complete